MSFEMSLAITIIVISAIMLVSQAAKKSRGKTPEQKIEELTKEVRELKEQVQKQNLEEEKRNN